MRYLSVVAIALLLGGCSGWSASSRPLFAHSDEAASTTPVLIERYLLVYFANDSAVITPREAAKLDRLHAELIPTQVQSIDVIGHTDSNHNDAYNQALGMRRAQAVFNYLGLHAVPASRVYATSHGEHQPSASNSTATGRQQNRRVEVRVRLLQ